jgi:aminomethyltransferase
MAFDPNLIVRQYGDPAEEVRACRTNCALFDFSFVGRARIGGSRALDAIGQLTRRPLGDLCAGQIRYAVREDRGGHLVSDLTIWRHDDHYEVMSGRSEDTSDLVRAAPPDCTVEEQSTATATFAVQGPGSLAALAEHLDARAVAELAYFTFTEATIREVPCIVGRLGYTGEAGFEIVLPCAAATEIWHLLAQTIRPAGFVAADILRIEAGFVLFANEFRVAVTASEAGFERFAGPRRPPAAADIALVCFRANTRERPVLWQPDGRVVRPALPGTIVITSACHSAAAGGTLGLGFVMQSDAVSGAPLHDPNGIFTAIQLVPWPFYDPEKRRPKAAWIK